MPGPSGTLSKCAPAITTLADDPVFVCAMTLRALKLWVLAVSLTVVGPDCPRSWNPTDLVTLNHRDLDVGISPQGAAHRLLVDVVSNDQRHRTALRGCVFLLGKRTDAAIYQHHRTGHRQPVVVRRTAARTVVGGGSHQRARHPVRRCAEAVLERPRLHGVAAEGHHPFFGLEHASGELRGLHIKTAVAQCVYHIVDAGLIARGAHRASAVVGVGDVLQFR